MMLFKKGDLIYCDKFDIYAVYLGKGTWTGWLRVHLLGENRTTHVHDGIWEIV